MASSHQQALADASSENRPPMLEKKSYVPWASQFMRYVDGKRESGMRIKHSILDGPFKLRIIPTSDSPADAPILRPQTYSDRTGDDKLNYEADIDVMNLILLGIPSDIYNSVDSCSTAQQMWIRVQRLIQGTELRKQEIQSRLMNEFDKFSIEAGESLESVYNRFCTLINCMDRNLTKQDKIVINTIFLNSLQPEWSKYVTRARQQYTIGKVKYDVLFDYLTQNEPDVKASRDKQAARIHDPLALVAKSYANPSSRSSQQYYVTHPPSVLDQDDDYQGEILAAKPEATLLTMMLLARAITQHFLTPTNNRLRASSNTRNKAFIQDGMVEIQGKSSGYVGVYKNFTIYQMDVKTAFLNGPLKKRFMLVNPMAL
ncbi:hypothetical protein Tco_1138312 [Tanacetum coccineum]